VPDCSELSQTAQIDRRRSDVLERVESLLVKAESTEALHRRLRSLNGWHERASQLRHLLELRLQGSPHLLGHAAHRITHVDLGGKIHFRTSG